MNINKVNYFNIWAMEICIISKQLKIPKSKGIYFEKKFNVVLEYHNIERLTSMKSRIHFVLKTAGFYVIVHCVNRVETAF